MFMDPDPLKAGPLEVRCFRQRGSARDSETSIHTRHGTPKGVLNS